jgi:hypothetical protein
MGATSHLPVGAPFYFFPRLLVDNAMFNKHACGCSEAHIAHLASIAEQFAAHCLFIKTPHINSALLNEKGRLRCQIKKKEYPLPRSEPTTQKYLQIYLKVPKCEIFDRSDFPDFYTVKSRREGDFRVKIKIF